MKTNEYPTMSASELLRTKNYAVVRCIDCAFAYTYDFCTEEEHAKNRMEYMTALTGDDYRVVEIGRESDSREQVSCERDDLKSALDITIDYISEECDRLIDRNKDRVFATMTDADHIRYERDSERFYTLRNVLAFIKGATFGMGFCIDCTKDFPTPDCTH